MPLGKYKKIKSKNAHTEICHHNNQGKRMKEKDQDIINSWQIKRKVIS
jgi:hypothetical protein